VGEHRGRVLAWPDQLAPAPDRTLATVHPASVLRSRNRHEDYAALVDDLRLVAGA
jgi:hypothetical protein